MILTIAWYDINVAAAANQKIVKHIQNSITVNALSTLPLLVISLASLSAERLSILKATYHTIFIMRIHYKKHFRRRHNENPLKDFDPKLFHGNVLHDVIRLLKYCYRAIWLKNQQQHFMYLPSVGNIWIYFPLVWIVKREQCLILIVP